MVERAPSWRCRWARASWRRSPRRGRVVEEGGVELRVREDKGGSWYRAMALIEQAGIGVVVSSDLPLEVVVAMAVSVEPIR